MRNSIKAMLMPALALVLLATAVQAAPTITAGSNPVMVPNGQASGITTITWKAASDYTYCEIYLSVDNGEWSEFAKGADGTKPATIKVGSSHTFRMMVYEGQAGTPKIITTLTVTTALGNLPPPAGGPGSYDPSAAVTRVETELGRGAAEVIRAARPLIENVRVERGSRHVIIRFKGPPNEVPFVAIGRAKPTMKNSEWVFGDNLVGGAFIGPATVSAAEKARGEYFFATAAATTISNDGLEPGKTYHYIITVPAGSGRQSYQDTSSFTMLGEATTVRVAWERVLILDDSDDLSTGEIQFWFWANYGQPSGKFSEYSNSDADSGRGYDISRSVVIENAPNTLSLSASGLDDDSNAFTSNFTEAGVPGPLSGPANRAAADQNVARGEFDLTQSPGSDVTVPFVLNAMPGGSLNFTIFGHFEITRRTEERTGTTSSGLGTDPVPARPVVSLGKVKPTPKALGRVKATSTSPADPPVSLCERARQARARNSPAASGLEAQCRAQGGTPPPRQSIPLGRVKPLTPTSQPDPPVSLCERARQARARNSPAASGLEGQCRAQGGTP